MTTTTTNHLPRITPFNRALLWLRWHQRTLTTALMIVLLASVLGLVAALLRPASAPQAQVVPTPALVFVYPTTVPTAEPVKVVQLDTHTLGRAVVAYDAPNGHVIGAIDQGHRYEVCARFGADWVQAEVSGSGLVWLRTADVFDLPTDLADLAPTQAPQVVYVASELRQPVVPSVDPIALPPAQIDAAFAAHQAREAAWAAGQAQQAQVDHPEHVPDSSEMPCNCP